MEQKKLKDLKNGEYLKRNQETNNVFVRGEYCRENKTYELHRFDNVNRVIYLKGDSLVWVGFTF